LRVQKAEEDLAAEKHRSEI